VASEDGERRRGNPPDDIGDEREGDESGKEPQAIVE
jgi:hypothetical protein